MTETLQPILALLDEGLLLYRRNFVGFAAHGQLVYAGGDRDRHGGGG